MTSGSGDNPVEILTSDDGEQVALHDFGGDGPAILFGHGNGLNAGMWAAAVPFLADRFHCYGIDLLGYGRCRPVRSDYSVDRRRFGEDVLRCVDHVGGPVRFAGHSLGGASAIFAALARPDAFEAMWLFEPVIIPADLERPVGGPPSTLIEGARNRRMEFDSVDDATARFLSKPPFSWCDPVAVRAYVEVGTYPVEGGVRLSCEASNEARVFGSSEPVDFARLAELTIPTVVAAGGDSDEAHAIPAKVAPLVAEALGNGRLERHDALSHFGPMQAPRAMAASIVDHFGTATG
ncbi:MAG: alpha/beta fold hydrolase [Acidimicrobiales bacterium]